MKTIEMSNYSVGESCYNEIQVYVKNTMLKKLY